MIVDALISYEFTYVKRGGRKARTVRVEDKVPVLVREIDEAEVYITCAAPGDAGTLTWRRADDRLYFERPRELPRPDAERTPFDMQPLRYDLDLVVGNPLDELPIREILEDGREAAILEVQSLAARHVVTPTTLLVESDGPYFTIVTDGDSRKAVVQAHDRVLRQRLPCDAVSLADLPLLETWAAERGFAVTNPYDTAEWPTDLLPATIADKVVVSQARFLSEEFHGLAIHEFPLELVRAHLEYTAPGFDRETAHPRLIELLSVATAIAHSIPKPGYQGEEDYDRNSRRGALAFSAERARFALELNGYLPAAEPSLPAP